MANSCTQKLNMLLAKVIKETATSQEQDSAFDLLWEMYDMIAEESVRLDIDLDLPEYEIALDSLIWEDILKPHESVHQWSGEGSDMAIAAEYEEYEEKLNYRQQYLRDIRSVLVSLGAYEPEYLSIKELMIYLKIADEHYDAIYQRLIRRRNKDTFGDLFKEVACSGGRQPRYLWNVKKVTHHLEDLKDTSENVNQDQNI